MSDDSKSDQKAAQNEEQGDEVEGHKFAAKSEDRDEMDSDDDVEAHSKMYGPKSD